LTSTDLKAGPVARLRPRAIRATWQHGWPPGSGGWFSRRWTGRPAGWCWSTGQRGCGTRSWTSTTGLPGRNLRFEVIEPGAAW